MRTNHKKQTTLIARTKNNLHNITFNSERLFSSSVCSQLILDVSDSVDLKSKKTNYKLSAFINAICSIYLQIIINITQLLFM